MTSGRCRFRRRAAGPSASTSSICWSRGLLVPPPEAERLARWEHLRHEDLDHVAGVLRHRCAAPGAVASVRASRHGITRRWSWAVRATTSHDWRLLSKRREAGRSSSCPTNCVADWVNSWSRRRAAVRCSTGPASRHRPASRARGHSRVRRAERHGQDARRPLVAGELGLPLYADRPGPMVSKYIGETETQPRGRFRRRRSDRCGPALRRGRGALRQAQRGAGRTRPLRQPRGRLPASADGAYDGVAILATNLLGHFDDAFAATTRPSACDSPIPTTGNGSSSGAPSGRRAPHSAADVDLDDIATRHPFTGGNIRNVAVAAVHLAHSRGDRAVGQASIERAIDREYAKLGKAPQAVSEALR